ncbi:MAG TPA: nitronate monooxygenase family protein [Acidimicrobiales bacterium]|nr:nitronate monooxygenase family protein [Acidimicrobiales bacterium]
MRTALCDELGIEYPIFAFSHCRDVVVAVSKAGGFGVLGGLSFTPEQLEIELRWIDEHVDGRPYGLDVVMPARDPGMDVDTSSREVMASNIVDRIPEQHAKFVEDLMQRFQLPPLAEETGPRGLLGWAHDLARELVEVGLGHPIKLLANALGSPPKDVIQLAHDHGVKVAALSGKVQHAERHVANGVDIVVAQGSEAGGHTGEIGTMVLVADVVDAVSPTPVLAAGGIGCGRQVAAALSLGAQGVWMGSLWLTTAESSSSPEMVERMLQASSSDTVRSRCLTGKPARLLRSAWTDAWESAESPGTLPAPLQNVLVSEANARMNQARRKELIYGPVGQVVGRMNQVQSVRDVMSGLVEEYIDTVERLGSGLTSATDGVVAAPR